MLNPGFSALVEPARLGSADVREWTYVGAEGRLIPVDIAVTARLSEVGEIAGYLFVASDMTKAKELSRLKDEFVGLTFRSQNEMHIDCCVWSETYCSPLKSIPGCSTLTRANRVSTRLFRPLWSLRAPRHLRRGSRWRRKSLTVSSSAGMRFALAKHATTSSRTR